MFELFEDGFSLFPSKRKLEIEIEKFVVLYGYFYFAFSIKLFLLKCCFARCIGIVHNVHFS